MYTAAKGISASALPYRRNAPKWITMTPSAVCELINKLARKGTHISSSNSHNLHNYFL